MEILKDKLQQEIRKTLQSVVYYGYDIISAEWDLLKAFDKYAQLQSLPKEPIPLRDESKSYDSQTCTQCGGRTSLVTGRFDYEPDYEPYNNGIEEESKVNSGDCWVGGFICDDCGNVQGLWHE